MGTLSSNCFQLVTVRPTLYSKSKFFTHLGEALDDADLGIVAREVERMAFLYKHNEENCHNCDMSKEVELDKERLLKEKDNKIESLKRRQVKTDQKKNELYQEKKKVIMENTAIKKELKKCQDMLAESQRKVTTLTVEKTTRASMAESAEEGDINQHIKCNHCDSSSETMLYLRSISKSIT